MDQKSTQQYGPISKCRAVAQEQARGQVSHRRAGFRVGQEGEQQNGKMHVIKDVGTLHRKKKKGKVCAFRLS